MDTTKSKYQITYNPMLPAFCSGCRKSADGKTPYVDFNLDLDYYGAVVFCEACAKEIAVLFGWVPKQELEEINTQLATLHEKVQETQALNVHLNTTLDSLFALRPSLHSDDDPAGNSDEPPLQSGINPFAKE